MNFKLFYFSRHLKKKNLFLIINKMSMSRRVVSALFQNKKKKKEFI